MPSTASKRTASWATGTTGCHYWPKGDDDQLKALAEKDLAGPTSLEARIELGDGNVVFSEQHKNDLAQNQPMSLHSVDSELEVLSFTVRSLGKKLR